MTDERGVLRRISWRELFPWLIIFRAFRLSISPTLLLVSTLAVFLSGIGWQVGSYVFLTEDQRSAVEKDLFKLKDIEIGKANAILETERNVGSERRWTADEARAVGALSTEDKLRFRAQAGYWARNPGKKLSVEEQMNMQPADAAIFHRFFSLHAAEFDKSGQEAAPVKELTATGIAMTPELTSGELAVAAAKYLPAENSSVVEGYFRLAGPFFPVSSTGS